MCGMDVVAARHSQKVSCFACLYGALSSELIFENFFVLFSAKYLKRLLSTQFTIKNDSRADF